MEKVTSIVNDIRNGNIKPIYLLMGEEPYYIDRISSYIEENLLAEEEKGFNQQVLYGRDVTVDDIVAASRRYPMMAERQVVIIKEAQELSRTIDSLEKYADNPMPSTVLVLGYKYKTIDKRKKLVKNIEKNGVVFESKKLYENQVGDWIRRVVSGHSYAIEPKAAAMLVEFLGNDLGRISKEIEKLLIILPKGATITPKDIEENIGFSKDYNVFELRKALAHRNQKKAYQITTYFAENPRDNPLVMTVGLVFSFFSGVLQYHGLKSKSPEKVRENLKISPYQVADYEAAAKNFPMKKVSQIVASLREIDVKSKGVGANSLPMGDLLKEMLIKIFI